VTGARGKLLARGVWLGGAAILLLALVLERVGTTGIERMSLLVGLSQGVALLAVGLVGLLVASRQPGNAIGWLYLAFWVLIALMSLASGYGHWATVVHAGAPGGTLAVWLYGWLWVPALAVLLSFPFLLFPDGRLLSPRWRLVAWWTAVAATVWSLGSAFEGNDYTDAAGHAAANPYTPPGLVPVANVLPNVGAAMFISAFLLCLASLVLRFRRSSGVERAQTKWLLFAGTITLGFLLLPGNHGADGWIDVGMGFVLALIPLAVCVAILRYRLYDIDRLISRTTSYAVVTGLLVLTYLSVVTVVSTLLPQSSSSLAVAAATLTAAALARPVLRRVQGAVDRRFNRARFDAQRTVEAFGGRLRNQVELSAVASDLVEAVERSLAPASAALWIRGPR
jgi:hypothetical protein